MSNLNIEKYIQEINASQALKQVCSYLTARSSDPEIFNVDTSLHWDDLSVSKDEKNKIPNDVKQYFKWYLPYEVTDVETNNTSACDFITIDGKKKFIVPTDPKQKVFVSQIYVDKFTEFKSVINLLIGTNGEFFYMTIRNNNNLMIWFDNPSRKIIIWGTDKAGVIKSASHFLKKRICNLNDLVSKDLEKPTDFANWNQFPGLGIKSDCQEVTETVKKVEKKDFSKFTNKN